MSHGEFDRRLEVILDGLADGVTVQDRSGRTVYANASAAHLCGFDTPEEMLRAPFEEIVARFEMLDESGAPFDVETLPGRRVLRGEEGRSSIVRVRERRTGREWWSLLRATSIAGADGRPELAINTWHDVTEERRRERDERYLAAATTALSTSLDFAATLSTLAVLLVPGLADWCVIHLLEGEKLASVVVTHVDPAKVAMAREVEERYPPDPRSPRGLWNVIRSGRSELYTDISDELLGLGAIDDHHLEILRSVGMRSVLLVPIRSRGTVSGTLSLISAESGRRYDEHDRALVEELGRRVGSTIENARLFAAEKRARDRAEEASRVKEEFLATVSHELRTPLNAIVGWSSILRSSEAEVQKGIEIIHRNALAQKKLVEDILDMSRITSGKLRLELASVDLVAILREAIDVIRPSLDGKQLGLDVRTPDGPCMLVADAERLQQIIWNLLSNAVKFTPAGGKVGVDVAREPGGLSLSVTDSGRGIEPTFLPFVFDRFKQEDSSITRRVGGLGLGLAIVRHLVELHGGHVRASSRGVGEGAVFAVSLPVRAVIPVVETPRVGGAAPLEPAPSRGALVGVDVLVVDDDQDARELLEALLTLAGARVETAGSAAEGRVALSRFRPHVVVSDIGMPGEDGYSFLRSVRLLPSALATTPAIAVTAYAGEEDRARAHDAGFSRHLGKPVSGAELVAAVSALTPHASASPEPTAALESM